MRRGGIIAALVLVAAGAAALLAFPRSPALLTQPQFFDATTYDLTKSRDVVQAFRATGTLTGVDVMYTTADHSGTVRHVTCTLFEIVSGKTPADWRERELAQANADVGRFPMRGPLAFAFPPVVLQQGKRYGIRFESDFPPNKLVLMRDQVPAASALGLYQGDRALTGALAFRLDSAAGSGGVYRVLRAGRTRPTMPASVAVGLLLALLAVAGLVVAEAPFPVAAVQAVGGSDDTRGEAA